MRAWYNEIRVIGHTAEVDFVCSYEWPPRTGVLEVEVCRDGGDESTQERDASNTHAYVSVAINPRSVRT